MVPYVAPIAVGLLAHGRPQEPPPHLASGHLMVTVMAAIAVIALVLVSGLGVKPTVRQAPPAIVAGDVGGDEASLPDEARPEPVDIGPPPQSPCGPGLICPPARRRSCPPGVNCRPW
jgi:hypothetical protein